MARITAYLPDQLNAQVRAHLPGLNVSRVLRDALVERLECHHERLECQRCAAVVSPLEAADELLGRFYGDVWERVGELARRAGTAEGAVKALREVGEAYGVSAVARYPLVRSTRATREAALAEKLAQLEPGRRRRRSA